MSNLKITTNYENWQRFIDKQKVPNSNAKIRLIYRQQYGFIRHIHVRL